MDVKRVVMAVHLCGRGGEEAQVKRVCRFGLLDAFADAWNKGAKPTSEGPGIGHSPVLSELHRRVSFSALGPGLGPCLIQVATVNWSVRFWGTTQSGILAAWRPANLKIRSLSRPLSVTREAVQLVAAPGAGRRSVLPEEAPAGSPTVGTDRKGATGNVSMTTLAEVTYERGQMAAPNMQSMGRDGDGTRLLIRGAF